MEKTNRPIPSSFSVSVISDLEPTSNPMVSKTRVATFYQGANRNHSFFTQEMSEKMIKRVVSTPVVGIYSEEKADFLQHAPPKDSRIYGNVPESHNFAWESRVDDDGVVRTYACFDVHLLTGRFPEAQKIIGKAQSMELDPKTISGSWRVVDGEEVFVYDEALLSGFCVLGDDYEPCFEGASFFAQEKPEDRVAWIDYLNTVRGGIADFMQQSTKVETGKQQIEGGTTQMKLNFGWAEDDARVALFEKLNPNFTEEKGWLVEKIVLDQAEGDAYSVYDLNERRLVTYSASGEAIEQEEVAKTEFCVYYNSQEEMDAAAALPSELESVKNEFASYKEEKEAAIATLNEEKDTFTASLEQANERVTQLEGELATYAEKDKELEEARKNDLIAEYSELLPEAEVREIADHQANFSYDELESKFALAHTRAVRKSASKVPAGSFTKTKTPGDELVALLSKYKK